VSTEPESAGILWPCPESLPPGHTPYSRENARKHGYVAQIDLQGESERASFYRLEGEFYNEYRPTSATESALLDEVVINYWRFQRARELEAQTLNSESVNPKLLALYFRYRTNFENCFYKALRLLRRVKAENLRLAERFEKHRRDLRRARFTPGGLRFAKRRHPAFLLLRAHGGSGSSLGESSFRRGSFV
jgi:hypothetical protein